jgi:light-regulated signal transduction histidine kinase (bacteriophytochrome)
MATPEPPPPSGDDLIASLQKENALLRAENERLTQLNSELNEFAYAASHDLQEPLRSITALVDILTEGHADEFSPRSRDYLRFIRESTKRLQHLITDLLDYSRLTSQPSEYSVVDLNEILNETLQSLHQSLQETKPCIQIDPLPKVNGDYSRLIRLFQNLVSNALKFSSPERSSHIHISAMEEESAWHLTVKDNGIGIPDDQLERVFRIFYRLHAQSSYPGTGVGLAICAKIVSHHRGTIWAEPVEEGGVTIHFTLAK